MDAPYTAHVWFPPAPVIHFYDGAVLQSGRVCAYLRRAFHPILVARLGGRWRHSAEREAVGLDYTRRLLAQTLGWYRNADMKSQILLTIDGAFLAFLTASVFRAPGDLRPILVKFGIETWILLGLMAFSLVASIVCALLALWSRSVILRRRGRPWATQPASPNPDTMAFFEDIRWLDREGFRRALHNIDYPFEIDALGSSIFVLASNVSKKHRWVDVGFGLSAATLLLFLSAAISYVSRTLASA